MIKYEELPKKFRLKFGTDYYGYGEGEKPMLTQYHFRIFRNDDFTKDSLVFAMIEKGVLTVEPLSEKRWRVFIRTFDVRKTSYYRYLTRASNLDWWFSPDMGDCETFTSFPDVLKLINTVQKLEDPKSNCDYWTIYAEEFEV